MTQQARLQMTSNEAETAWEPYVRRTTSTFIPIPQSPIGRRQLEALKSLQSKFDAAFPPMKADDQEILIVSWDEIERQFLDLCAPWDRRQSQYLIRQAQQIAQHESPEKTLRTLFVLNQIRTSIDTPEPRWGTGENFPMP